MSSVSKITAERHQRALLDLAIQPGNDVCADCKARNPRWASYNLGIFICVHCASIHRKIGTHITKVKSLTLDSWTKEQIETMKGMGNLNSNAIFNPDETRHPPPVVMMDSERDSELEMYIRAKYEYKKFLNRSALVASKLGPSRSRSSVSPGPSSAAKPLSSNNANDATRSASTLNRPISAAPPAPSLPSTTSQIATSRSVSQPLSSLSSNSQFASRPPQQQASSNPVWNDLISLQAPSSTPSLPLQYQMNVSPSAGPLPFNASSPMSMSSPSANTNSNPYANISANPNPFPSTLQSPMSGISTFSPGPALGNMSMANTGMGMSTGSPFFQQQRPMYTSASTNPFGQQFSEPLSAGNMSSVSLNSANPLFEMGSAGGMSMQQMNSLAPQPSNTIQQAQFPQQQPSYLQQHPPFAQQQNPFSQQRSFSLPVQSGHAAQPFQQQQQYLSTQTQGQSPNQPQQQQQFFQPQPQSQQQGPFMTSASPFGQHSPSPFGNQPGGAFDAPSHSPFLQAQPSPAPYGQQDASQQQQQQMFLSGSPNAFGGWVQGQQGQQGAYQGQQWNGM